MDARVDKTLRITTPSDLEFAMTRQFDAPRHLVFDAMTRPEYLVRWLGCEEMAMPVCEVDLRVGGRYRYVFRSSDGIEHVLTGTFREVVRPDRIAFGETFSMPGFTSDEYLVTSTFVEAAGTTTLTTTIRHPTKEARDGHLNSGIEKGVEPAYDRLAEIVAGMG
ncbi:SRPBCC domain-containing protein [Bradyrhizobium sp. 2S1]|uniref:SRPBCC domain-containing protein n=1 Tax=Bradyrhizobium sp. 2S1 TaxID=1404429 RepID=UPI001AEDB290|nr:SRPBCC domain-containing protein [Bradyrhizobium sp. 2S1]MCK7666662.1 SRPBCC domain-containing protein [Bradyrhizobium sp. 2S1]